MDQNSIWSKRYSDAGKEYLFGTEPKPPERPLMYQGMSHQFIAPTADVVLPTPPF